MVSIKRNISLFFINCAMFLCFIGMSCLAIACPSGQAECCKGTTLSCCPHPGYGSDGTEKSYDLSACRLLERPDRPAIGGELDIVKCLPGDTQNKYTASGCSYSTSTRTCCSYGGWSNWDEECKACEDKNPCTSDADCCNGRSCIRSGVSKVCGAQCSESSKPTCSLAGGTCSYICTCDTSTGKWENCQKRQRCNVGYESVTVSNGICCQKSDGTGPRCAGGDIGIGYRWVAAGTNCWDKSECGNGCPSNLSDGLACSESQVGNWCSKWDYSVTDVGCDGQFKYRNGQGVCRQYYCRG